MGDLISRSYLANKIGSHYNNIAYGNIDAYNAVLLETENETIDRVLRAIESAPSVDAEPVMRGEWVPTSDANKKRCSRCDVIHLIAQYPHGQANFCPNCGADMRRKKKK